VSFRQRIFDYLSKYPSVGLLRLVFDLAPPGLRPGTREWERFREEVEKAVRELEKLGLVKYAEPGVVNLCDWLESGWRYAGGAPPWTLEGSADQNVRDARNVCSNGSVRKAKQKAADITRYLSEGGEGPDAGVSDVADVSSGGDKSNVLFAGWCRWMRGRPSG
jgi:hypothetical protein